MLPESLRRLAFSVVGAMALALVTSTSALAQGSTGKIQGRVVDSSTGQPIAAAQVEVVGTNRGNITNDDGYYFINDVPAGLMDIRAVSIGYQEVVISDQRILAGQTHTQNFSLAPTAVEIEAIVIEGEANPLVPRDQVSSRAIVTGETIDQLPLDNAESIVALQPGVITTNSGVTIRGSRPNEEATYVDGVLVRRFQTGDASPLELPTNALAQVDVTTGGFSARYSDAQSGIVNYTTRSGGNELGGSVSYMTDMIAPSDWRTGLHRAEASVGGPVFGALSFFLAGTAEGRQYSTLVGGTIASGTDRFIIAGIDTTFMVASDVAAETGLTDSIEVAFPRYERWENERMHPYNRSDEYNFVSRLNYGLGGGSNLSASYYRNRDQVLHRGAFYNPQTMEGNYSTADVLTLGGYFVVLQTADQAVALDVKASYQNFWNQMGHVNAGWLADHSDPALNFNFSSIDFIVDPDDYPLTDDVFYGLRSRVLNEDSLFALYPDRKDLSTRQSYTGLPVNLRLNPYALYTGFSIAGYEAQIGGLGVGGAAGEWRQEENWAFTGSVDWQAGRYNRIFIGGDYTDSYSERMQIGLFEGPVVPYRFEPTRAGFFLQDRLDLGDVVLEAGVRYDYFKPGGDFPRVPGFVTTIPDSLRGDAYEIREGGDWNNPDDVVQVEDCGGESTRTRRTRADGTVVCKNNFIEAETKTAWSPRLAVSFPVTATSTFRLSYGQNVQVPALQEGYFDNAGGIAQGQAGMFASHYSDLDGGFANTNTRFGRDVDLPRTTLFEAGYRRLFGESLVFDIAAYAKTVRNGLSYRTLPFVSPSTGRTENINVLTNADYSLTRGIDVRVDKRFGEFLDVTGSYSFVDARGTGSDPASYVDILKRGSSVLSLRTGQPIAAPEAMLPLDQSRAHNFSGTASLLFPADYDEGFGLLSDVGVFATFSAASGLPYTRIGNIGSGVTGPPTDLGGSGEIIEALNASRTDWMHNFDLRLHKGFALAGLRMRAFADWRNPFDIENIDEVFLETGTVENEEYFENATLSHLIDARLDGDTEVDDFYVRCVGYTTAERRCDVPAAQTVVNQYALQQAEKLFGDGDGLYTVEEQTAAMRNYYDNWLGGEQFFRESDQSLRLGLELVF